MEWNRQRAIIWALNFAFNQDLSRLREPGRYKMYEDLKRHLFYEALYAPALTPDIVKPQGGGLESIQDTLRQFFETYLFPILKLKSKLSAPLPEPPALKGRWFYLDRYANLRMNEYPEADYKDVIVERIIGILFNPVSPPLPYTGFLRCEECETFFANKRFKKFCTPKCNRRHNARKQRGEPGSKQRRAYNKRQADLMRRNYQERKREELGAKVKVGRKTR